LKTRSSKSVKRIIKSKQLKFRIIKDEDILDLVADNLGFKYGFKQFETEFDKIEQFLKTNKMTHQENLVEFRKGSIWDKLTYRKISDRFFFSNKEIPIRLFTGFGFDWESFYDEQMFLPSPDHWQHMFNHSPCFNLLGSALTEPFNPEDLPFKLYFPKSMKKNEIKRDIEKLLNSFKKFREKLMLNYHDGWLQVLPFNKSLIFLKSNRGTYDFIFRNQRDNLPPKVIEGLEYRDTPKEIINESFGYIDYFRTGTWGESEEHESEKYFYSCGGESPNYPGLNLWAQMAVGMI
jgi:hypothetical protein